jgi:hypothetical protein
VNQVLCLTVKQRVMALDPYIQINPAVLLTGMPL